MYEETDDQPSIEVEIFGGNICRAGSVFVASWLGYGCEIGYYAVNCDVFDEETTWDDGCA